MATLSLEEIAEVYDRPIADVSTWPDDDTFPLSVPGSLGGDERWDADEVQEWVDTEGRRIDSLRHFDPERLVIEGPIAPEVVVDGQRLVSLLRLAAEMGVTEQAIHRWRKRYGKRGFPPPKVVDGVERWRLLDVREWRHERFGSEGEGSLDRLASAPDLAVQYRVTRHVINAWAQHPGFPIKVPYSGHGVGWDEDAVARWVERYGKNYKAFWEGLDVVAWGVSNIARAYRVADGTALRWTQHPSFPEALNPEEEGRGRLYNALDVRRWHSEASRREDMGIRRAGRDPFSPHPNTHRV